MEQTGRVPYHLSHFKLVVTCIVTDEVSLEESTGLTKGSTVEVACQGTVNSSSAGKGGR
jgi:hypothetical protein